MADGASGGPVPASLPGIQRGQHTSHHTPAPYLCSLRGAPETLNSFHLLFPRAHLNSITFLHIPHAGWTLTLISPSSTSHKSRWTRDTQPYQSLPLTPESIRFLLCQTDLGSALRGDFIYMRRDTGARLCVCVCVCVCVEDETLPHPNTHTHTHAHTRTHTTGCPPSSWTLMNPIGFLSNNRRGRTSGR